MQHRPTDRELLAAVGDFLKLEILPQVTEHRLKFRTLVAVNLLAIVGRELASEEQAMTDEWARLDRLLGSREELPQAAPTRRQALLQRNRRLCELIRREMAPIDTADLVQETLRDQLRIANPRYLDNFEPV